MRHIRGYEYDMKGFVIYCLNKAKDYMGTDGHTEIDDVINIINDPNRSSEVFGVVSDPFECAKKALEKCKDLGFDDNPSNQSGGDPIGYDTNEVDWVLKDLEDDPDKLYWEFEEDSNQNRGRF